MARIAPFRIIMPDMPNETETAPPHERQSDAITSDLLRQFLEHNDAPCPVCGYNLRMLLGDICPECGQRFRLQVGAFHLRFGLFLLFLTPLLMMAGITLIQVISLSVFMVLHGGGTSLSIGWGAWLLLSLGLLEGIAVFPLYRRRRFFLARSLRSKCFLVAMVWMANLLMLVFVFGVAI